MDLPKKLVVCVSKSYIALPREGLPILAADSLLLPQSRLFGVVFEPVFADLPRLIPASHEHSKPILNLRIATTDSRVVSAPSFKIAPAIKKRIHVVRFFKFEDAHV